MYRNKFREQKVKILSETPTHYTYKSDVEQRLLNDNYEETNEAMSIFVITKEAFNKIYKPI